MKLHVIANNVSNGLGISSRARATTVNMVSDLGKLVTNSIGHISSVKLSGWIQQSYISDCWVLKQFTLQYIPSAGTRICSNHNSSIEFNSHDRCLRLKEIERRFLIKLKRLKIYPSAVLCGSPIVRVDTHSICVRHDALRSIGRAFGFERLNEKT